MKKLILLLTSLVVLAGCQKNHLEIFPDLTDEKLIAQKLSVNQMHEDIDAFLNGALERHPDIETFANVAELSEQAEQLKKSINKPLNRREFYRVVGKLSPYFKDGHSFLIWPYQELNKARESGQKTFPFAIRVTNNGRLILKNAYTIGEYKIPLHTEILSINGVPSDAILANLMQYSGGETALLRKHAVALRFGISLWASYGWLDKFRLELLLPDGKQALTIDNEGKWPVVDEKAQGFVASYSTKDHYYKKLSDDVGFIYLSHFDVEPEQFEDFIDETFTTIRQQGIKKLIIDIRDNPGGNTDTVTYLARHLANKPFRLISKLKEKLNNENRGWFNYKGEVGEILISDWDEWETPVQAEKRFFGDTYLLIGPITYSASIVLATTLKDNNIATLVGETTGGYANQSAQGNLFNLPHSELRAYITTRMLVRPSGDLSRHGVVPHYKIDDYNFERCTDKTDENFDETKFNYKSDNSLRLINLLIKDVLESCKKG